MLLSNLIELYIFFIKIFVMILVIQLLFHIRTLEKLLNVLPFSHTILMVLLSRKNFANVNTLILKLTANQMQLCNLKISTLIV